MRTPLHRCADAEQPEVQEEFRQRALRIAKNVGQAVGRMHDAGLCVCVCVYMGVCVCVCECVSV
jgi:hypothetical protein